MFGIVGKSPSHCLPTPLIIGILCSIMLIISVMSGCAWIKPIKSPDYKLTESAADENGWWYASFVFNWPEDSEPAWHRDLLIAHRIVAPVLSQYRNKIRLWRFHRRAGRDQVGHQFSFIFYSSPDTAKLIYSSLKAAPLLKEMRDRGMIIKESYDDTGNITRPGIDGTSDRNWSPHMKRSWPYYIMGVSHMWLNLITEIGEKISEDDQPLSFEEVQIFYEEIDKRIKGLWLEEGGHALLHHLNAIFGYEPVMVYEKRKMRF